MKTTLLNRRAIAREHFEHKGFLVHSALRAFAATTPEWRLKNNNRTWSVVVAALVLAGQTALGSLVFTFTENRAITDNDPNGILFQRTVSGVSGPIAEVRVILNISGGYNGDLYADVTYGTGYSVLLNGAGRTAGNPFGYSDPGLAGVTFADAAANGDIHLYGPHDTGSPLTGIWQPDARAEDPALVSASTLRTAFLSSFVGLDPNGTWEFYLADVDPGQESTLESWSLELVLVPEPTTCLAGALLLLPVGVIMAQRCLKRKALGAIDRSPNPRISNMRYLLLAIASTAYFLGTCCTPAATVFSTDFEADLPTAFGGSGTVVGSEGFAAYGFGDNFLRNDSLGSSATFTLDGLAPHSSVTLSFWLAILDTWDGSTGGWEPDFFNVRVNGALVFSETFDNHDLLDGSYDGAPLAFGCLFGGDTIKPDTAYQISVSIPDGQDSLTVEWFANGDGWQGGTDESFAIDNIQVDLQAVPEPSTYLAGALLLLPFGLQLLRGRRRIAPEDHWKS